MSDATRKAIPVIEDIIRDRDEWKQQHENLLVMYRKAMDELAALRAPVERKGEGVYEECAAIAEDTANEGSAHPEWNLACWEIATTIRAAGDKA